MKRDQSNCLRCRHFLNDPAFLEGAFAGLAALSSAYASVRADDGLCRLHDHLTGAASICNDFAGAPGAAGD
jgi:hypothetical protein